MQCHTIKTAQKLSIYNRKENYSVHWKFVEYYIGSVRSTCSLRFDALICHMIVVVIIKRGRLPIDRLWLVI